MGTRYSLSDEAVFIGRQDDCAIQNIDGSVSRYHARITRGYEGGYMVTDLGSTNGTELDGVRVQEATAAPGARSGPC